MRLTLQEIEAEAPTVTGEMFEIELPSGEVLALPHPEGLPASLLLINEGDVQSILGMLRAAAALPAPDGAVWRRLLDSFPARQLPFILQRYIAAYGVGAVGEGGASRPRSNGSATRSKRTSGSRRTASRS